MNPIDTFGAGIAPQHVPALLAACLLPILVFIVRRLRGPLTLNASASPTSNAGINAKAHAGIDARAGMNIGSYASADPVMSAGPDYAGKAAPRDPVRIWVAWLLGISAAVHLALPLGHFDGPVLAIAFLGSGAAYAWLAMRALEGRSWRLLSALLIVATLIAYLANVGGGAEEADQVGIATALVELAALGFCLIPSRETAPTTGPTTAGSGPLTPTFAMGGIPRKARPRRFARFMGSAGTVFATFVVGAVVWIGSFVSHANAGASVSTPDDAVLAAGHSNDHSHQHDHAARAQAGVIMRPGSGAHPTFAQQQAADQLAAATREAIAKYANLDTALAAGYALPKLSTGTDVHVENKAYTKDGRILDPQRPETLVYAISGGRATLLGAMFVMERAGVAAPEPGGPLTRWHAHNICLTAIPPGFGIVSPFGTCPALSVSITTPEMMHVWVVVNPGGWFADGLDKDWVHAYHAEHGQPYATR